MNEKIKLRNIDELLLELSRDKYIDNMVKSRNKSRYRSITIIDETDFTKHGIDSTPREVATSFNRSLIALKLPLKAEVYHESKKFKLPEGMKPDSSIILRPTKNFDITNYDLLDRGSKLPDAYKNLLAQEYIKNRWPNIKFPRIISKNKMEETVGRGIMNEDWPDNYPKTYRVDIDRTK